MSYNNSLYRKRFESDACGIGCVANINGTRSNDIIVNSLTVLENMSHRGATGNNKKIGDGAGLKTQIPHKLLLKELSENNLSIPSPGNYGLGMFFLPNNIKDYNISVKILTDVFKKFRLDIIYKRKVPSNKKDLCHSNYSFIPKIEQWIIKPNNYFKNEDEFNKGLYISRRYIENLIGNHNNKNLSNSVYIASLSTNIVVYKGQLTTHQVRTFYPDLSNHLFENLM